MSESPKKIPCCTGLLAHVDAGKTTLSEALLYTAGAVRSLGRVDHGDACLDTHRLERQRGITIFSKQARLSTAELDITLVDTPGHVDFAAEAERTMPILDCAVLLISGTDGIQAHTVTLWRLLESYQIPTFLFINKMDLPDTEQAKLMAQLRELSENCVDFTASVEQIQENAALCDEALLETFLSGGSITAGNIQNLIRQRKLFPCCFGSALKLTGIRRFLEVLNACAPRKQYPRDFSARVYKISRDAQGSRLTWLKVTGGSLKVRSPLPGSGEKPQQLRLYTGDRFVTTEEAFAGMLCAVTGLRESAIGQVFGEETTPSEPVVQSVMSYRVASSADPMTLLPKLKELEEEEPQLKILWDDKLKQIHVRIMGRVQLEILRALVLQRFGVEITLEEPRILYKETIEAPVEGVGHFEPLRHYAEVHLLLEPLPRGSGLEYDTVCSTDVLDMGYQSLILSHMSETSHPGVLTGSPITDIKITLLIGKAHLKHTEGGDFRQATYRAIRQGLMGAKSVLLEPWYDFTLTLPAEQIGRAITDIRAMGGSFDSPETAGAVSTLRGQIPVSELGDYADTLAAYTRGQGRLQVNLAGYAPCHNADAVISALGYDPEADTDRPADSVFCAHGAGFNVKWHQVQEYMHLESPLKTQRPEVITRNLSEDKALEAILQREFGTQTTKLYRPPENRPAEEKLTIRPMKQQYLIVDGYNIIFAWDELAAIAREDLDAARRRLCDLLSSYAGYRKCVLVVVFDGYKQKGSAGSRTQWNNIRVVYTAEGETADAYIEALASQVGSSYNLRIASSDGMIQLTTLRSGSLRLSARELWQEVQTAREEMRKHFSS